ncbi:MAG: amidophosphoribosyltransferase [Hyphomicrobiaceae bacterium]|nr:amidophosphoribosyltransferase [Hyphomicrobiaceae bacterium]
MSDLFDKSRTIEQNLVTRTDLHEIGDEDTLHEECGVFGIFDHDDAAAFTTLGLHALQHRGQEAAGIISFDGKRFISERHLGKVGDHFTSTKIIDKLVGRTAIGHVRYSTTGDTILQNTQPLYADLATGGFAICHNGNLTNAITLREELIKDGAICQTTSDTEVVLHLVARSRKRLFVDRLIEALGQIEGAYAFVGLTNKKLIGARDPYGIRPLVLGKQGNSYVLASETCALKMIDAEFVREIENGEIVVIDKAGISSYKPFGKCVARPCIFEYIYFARPDSIVGGHCVYDVRKKMGYELAKEAGVEADVVIAVPDSGVPAAIGFAQESNIPFELGIIRNHYVGRTFIEPAQKIRELGVRLKHSANCHAIAGKRIVLVDDSIVRGTTSMKIVKMMYEAGAKEVHMRISSPPITYPDFYGIDTPKKESLIAAGRTVEEVNEFIGADSLAFLSIEGIYKAMGHTSRNDDVPQYTDHCFTGEYPTRLLDRSGQDIDKQLSLLVEESA